MRLIATVIPCLLFLCLGQSPQETIKQHYEAAEIRRAAGDLIAAEAEYTAILAEGYQRLGETYLALEDHRRAVTVLETAAAYRGDSATVLLDLAIAYYDTQQYAKALVPAGRVLAGDRDNPGAHQMLGKTFFMLGDLGKSIAELEIAARLAPQDVDVAYTLGIAYLRNRQPEAARQLYDTLLKNFGERPQLHLVIGRAYRQSGLMTEAEAEFKQAIALDPHFPRAHYYLGITYLLDEGQRRMDEALSEFQIEVAANPDEFFANYYLGVVYIFQRKWQPAITFLLKAAAIQPNNPDPYFQLGQAYQELKRDEQAIEVLQKAIGLNPDLGHNKGQVTTAHHRLAQSLARTGQQEASQRELQIASDLKVQAFKLEQQAPTAAADLRAAKLSEPGQDAAGMGQSAHLAISSDLDDASKQKLSGAAAYYEKVVAAAHNNIGLLRAQRQDFRAAAAQFSLSAAWNPEQEGINYNLGLAYYKSGSFQKATVALAAELQNHPTNNAARLLLGMSWFTLEKYANAEPLLAAALDPATPDLNIYYSLASALIEQGKAAEAARVIDQIGTSSGDRDSPQRHLLIAEREYARHNPTGALAQLALVEAAANLPGLLQRNAGLLYSHLRRPADAGRLFEKDLATDPGDVQARYYLAATLLDGSDVERGLKLIRSVIEEWPEYADARFVLGQVLLRRGERTDGISNLENAVKLDPERPEFHYQLGQAYLSAGRQAEGKTQLALATQLQSSKPDRAPE